MLQFSAIMTPDRFDRLSGPDSVEQFLEKSKHGIYFATREIIQAAESYQPAVRISSVLPAHLCVNDLVYVHEDRKIIKGFPRITILNAPVSVMYIHKDGTTSRTQVDINAVKLDRRGSRNHIAVFLPRDTKLY